MTNTTAWLTVTLTLALATPLPAAGTPSTTVPAPHTTAPTPHVFHSACELGASMAAKIGVKRMSHEAAQRMCRQLQPTMDAANAAEFLRCCEQRFEAGPPAPPAKHHAE